MSAILSRMNGDATFLALLYAVPPFLGLTAWLFFRRIAAGRQGSAALLIGNLLLLLLLLSTAFAGIEAWYRWGYDTTSVWNRARISKRWFERHWHENANGYRDSIDYADAIAPGKRRITFLGDSNTAAHGVADVDDRFANLVRRTRPDWEVHAIARNGVNTLEQVEELRRLIADGYELDVLLLVYCYNDIDSHIPEFQTLYQRTVESPPALLAPLVRSSYAADFFYQRWWIANIAFEEDVSYPALRRAAYTGRAWGEMEYNLGLIAADARKQGARYGVVTFPWLQMMLANDPVPEMHAVLDRYWESQSIPHLDLQDVYESQPAGELVVNLRDTHPNERAHAMAAEAIIRFVEQKILPLPEPRDAT